MKEKIISLATSDKQDEILKGIESLKENKQENTIDIVDQLILTGAFTANSTVATMNWIWNSDKMGKVASIMIPSESEKFLKKTNLDSIFADAETRKIFINHQGLMDTAMHSFGVKKLFLKNIDAVIEILKSNTSKDYILSDENAVSEILNNDLDLKKFYDAFINDETLRDNIKNSQYSYLREKIANNQNILVYYINHGKETNDFLTYNQIFSSDKALQNDFVRKNLNYNFIEFVSIMNGNNLDVIMRNDLLKEYIKSKDERVQALIRNTDAVLSSAFKYEASSKTIVSDSDLFDKVINSETKATILCNNISAINVIASDVTATSRLLDSSISTNALFSSHVGMREFLNYPDAYKKIIDGTLKNKIVNFTPAIKELVKNNDRYSETLKDEAFRKSLFLNSKSLSIIFENINNSFSKVLKESSYYKDIINDSRVIEQFVKDKNAINTYFDNIDDFSNDLLRYGSLQNAFLNSDTCGEVFRKRKDVFDKLKDNKSFLSQANDSREKAFRFFSSEYVCKIFLEDRYNQYKKYASYYNITIAVKETMAKFVYERYKGDFFTGEETKKRLLKDPAFYDKFCLGSRYLYLYAKENMKLVHIQSEDAVNRFNPDKIKELFRRFPNAVIFASLGTYSSGYAKYSSESVYSYVYLEGSENEDDKYTYDCNFKPQKVDEDNVSAVLLEGMGLNEKGDGYATIAVFVPK